MTPYYRGGNRGSQKAHASPKATRRTCLARLGALLRFGLLLLAALPAAGGCAADANRLPDRTGGISLDLLVHTADDTDALYRVERSGLLKFGGGLDAVLDRTSWEGPLTDEEIQRLAGMLDRFDWIRRPPESTGHPRETVWRVTVQTPRGRRRFRTEG